MRWMWALVALAACDSSPKADLDAGLFCEVYSYGLPSNHNVADILFVIDTSPAMQPYADTMALNLPRFANVLENIEGGLPSLHIGFATASGGALTAETAAGCTSPDGDYLIDEAEPWFRCPEDEPRCGLRNYDGPLSDALTCIAPPAGDTAVPREPLAALLSALDGSIPTNAGFLRPDTVLQIVIIAAGDDASPLSPADYAEGVRDLVDDPRLVLVSIVAPADSPRLQAFADAFPQRNLTVDIAETDWSSALVTLAELFKRLLAVPCLADVNTTDLAPSEPGLQLDCAVTATDGSGFVFPACSMLTADRPHPDTPLPCWWIRDWGDINGSDCRYTAAVEYETGLAPYPDVRCAGTCE